MFSGVRKSIGKCQAGNPALLSSGETGVDHGIRSRKTCLSESTQCQEAVCGIYFTQTWRSEALEHGLEIVKYQPLFEVDFFEYMSCVNHPLF
jgi:hypothetical protein